jgi:hypothetical protein
MNIHFNIIPYSKPKFPTWSTHRLPHKNYVHVSSAAKFSACTARIIPFEFMMICGSLSSHHAAGGDGLQIWRVATNLLKKKAVLDSREGVFVHIWVGEELTVPRRKNWHVTKYAKVLPIQATKALRVNRGIALPYLRPRHGRWGWVVNATTRSLYPRERPGIHCTGSWVGLDGCGKFRPHLDSIPGPSSP